MDKKITDADIKEFQQFMIDVMVAEMEDEIRETIKKPVMIKEPIDVWASKAVSKLF